MLRRIDHKGHKGHKVEDADSEGWPQSPPKSVGRISLRLKRKVRKIECTRNGSRKDAKVRKNYFQTPRTLRLCGEIFFASIEIGARQLMLPWRKLI